MEDHSAYRIKILQGVAEHFRATARTIKQAGGNLDSIVFLVYDIEDAADLQRLQYLMPEDQWRANEFSLGKQVCILSPKANILQLLSLDHDLRQAIENPRKPHHIYVMVMARKGAMTGQIDYRTAASASDKSRWRVILEEATPFIARNTLQLLAQGHLNENTAVIVVDLSDPKSVAWIRQTLDKSVPAPQLTDPDPSKYFCLFTTVDKALAVFRDYEEIAHWLVAACRPECIRVIVAAEGHFFRDQVDFISNGAPSSRTAH